MLLLLTAAAGVALGWWLGVRARVRSRELRSTERFLNSIIENIPDMVFLKDARDLRFVRFNKAGEDLLGFSREQLIGKNDHDFFPKSEADFFTAKDRQVLSEGKLIVIPEEPIETKLKGRRVLRTKKIPILDETGRPQYLLGISDDITDEIAQREEIKRLRSDQEQRLAELTAANEELEAFNYSVSHDLRKPLSHISGYAELLLKNMGPGADEKQSHYLTVVANAAQRMGVLIDDLLAFSRLGRAPLKLVPVDMGALVKEVRADLADEDKEGRIAWNVARLPPSQGDPAMLRLVLVNLLSNAIKFSRKAAQPAIELGSRPPQQGQNVYFVKDNGVGFTEKDAAGLFTAFKRLHPSSEFEGSGIGLATVRRIILRHGGRTWAEGRPNDGAAVYFSLPA